MVTQQLQIITILIRSIIIFVLLVFTLGLNAQIEFTNPSFEGDSSTGLWTHDSWTPCKGSPDAIVPGGSSQVPDPTDGISYLAIGTSPNVVGIDKIESIGQELQSPLKNGYVYEFTADICKFDQMGLYSDGIVEISLGQNMCSVDTIVYSEIIDSTGFKKHLVEFTPTNNYTYITFSAAFDEDSLISYFFIDNLSTIQITNTKEIDFSEASFIYSNSRLIFSDLGGKFELYSITGVKVMSFKIGQESYWMEGIPNGMYVGTYKNKKKREVRVLTIN